MTGHGATSKDPPADAFGTADVATATTDEQGIVTGWSEGARRLFGHRPEDVVGRPAAELLAEDAPADGAFLAGQPSWTGHVAVRHRDGHPVSGELLAHRRVGRNGSDWLLVWDAARGPAQRAEDGVPIEWCFSQSPCILAIFDTDLRYVHTNADEEHAIALTRDQVRGMRMTEAAPHPACERIEQAMRRVLETRERQYLEVYLSVAGERRQHAWAIHLAPLNDPAGRLCGVCFAAQDTTEQYEARQRLLLLNEAGKHIGTSLDMTVTTQQLADLAVPRLADFVAVDLLTGLDGGGELPSGPMSGPVTMRRTAQRSILPGAPESSVGVGETATPAVSSPAAEWLGAVAPAMYQMTDPALARWADHEPVEAARLRDLGTHSVIVAPLRTRGVGLGVAFFIRHRRPEPFQRDDLLLVEELTARTAVCIDNARRYTRERTRAVTFQRSLLPWRLAEQTALEVASRYLPACTEEGVGGDWFDIIPLSGARVALVIGSVVGHGIQASATMGRLRTAVRTLADLDFLPDELLTHLDDVVIRLNAEAPTVSGPHSTGDVGATCLYAIYDPVSRRCSLARAGHSLPVVRRPDGTVDFLDLPGGPPLGLGNLPFEAVEVELPEGSILALYTDGLIEGHAGDTGEKVDLLRQPLAQPAESLEAVCDTVLDAMVPGRSEKDIALLLARTRVLPADRVATWNIPFDPIAVAGARKNAFDQLAAWGLEEFAFITELVVSELVTNAIRYGAPPIRLRLINDRSLICEVRDNSSTAPHLKRARVFDEGGRGLLLVAQLTQRWGTRHSDLGKTIWAEQDLPGRP
ncbi:SpoIIE family protein phosphatase [Streptomyces sp. JH14]|uniref:SpoIIE family protein phosphatase n=1 Tax=Streptomyces sp. JH14 TaxID=2793630 RepID=UPI0023F7BD2B|nr:SpoIIE family protein phosphatase [Streptomyces sp. JH14]MDF6041013.1 SpoIIE family protein phosphatase [Streptomyces sp. JH14]